LAIFDRQSRNLYSLNDRGSDPARLDLVITAPSGDAGQIDETRLAAPNAILASLPIDAGIAMIRVFVPDRASLPVTRAALAAADCNAAL
jgi:uncharacterized membrane protein